MDWRILEDALEKGLNECKVKGQVSLEYLQYSPLSHTSPLTYQLTLTSLSPNNSVKWWNLVFMSSLVNIQSQTAKACLNMELIYPAPEPT